MRVRVRFFASCREAVGASELVLELPEGGDVVAVLEEVYKTFPTARESLRTAALSRNLEYVSKEEKTMLRDGDEIAFIPPVSGG